MHILSAKPLPSQDALIAAGLVLEQLGPNAQISQVVVNGERVADVDAARAAFAAASVQLPPGNRKVIDKVADWLARNVDKYEASLRKTETGRKLHKVIMADPERVTHRVAVEVDLKNGRHIAKDVDVLDRDATHFLQSASLIAELLANIPIPLIGTILALAVPAAAVLTAAIAALITRATGKQDLSRALAHTAGKHAAILSVGWVPVFGFGVLGVAAVVDNNNIRENRLAPPASLVEGLTTQPKAAPALEHAPAPA